MSDRSLTARARALTHAGAATVAALGVTAIANAASALTLTFDEPGQVSTSGGTPSGGPLSAISGNGTDAVKLAGSAGVTGDFLNPPLSVEFVNEGTLTARAGERLDLDYDFEATILSGGGTALNYVVELTVDGATSMQTGSVSDVEDSSSILFDGMFGTDPFATDLNGAPVELRLEVTLTEQSGEISLYQVTVPENSIDITGVTVPAPAAFALLAPLLPGLWFASRRRRRAA